MDTHCSDPNTPGLPQMPFTPPGGQMPYAPVPPTRRSGAGWKIFFGIVLGLSMLANAMLLAVVFAVVAVFSASSRSMVDEAVVRQGPASNKIAVVSIAGMIAGDQADYFHRQIEAARKDKAVKGVIIRVNSPGGTIAASDRIYNEIRMFRKECSKPVVAFMEALAASGGYYASVACEKIIAEPTTITGSIGVISWYFAMQELLEDKLGIVPVVVTGGEKKDWPSSFRVPTEEQRQYLQERLITPAYERFVQVVIDGRKGVLAEPEVRKLADGSIYTAELALAEKLIDRVGYLDDAIDVVKSMAKVKEVRVVEYRRPFTMSALLRGQESMSLKVDKMLIHELSRPELMYLWSAF
ncbi:MAG TPA: signal peptide peptidase SppA [Phycisphaerales bacterium]|nr:signal peptide peptidase SppA [Phycisphaerales bacterium]